MIETIICGALMGSAVVYQDNRFITAAHVVERGDCRIDDEPVSIIYLDKDRDIAIGVTRRQRQVSIRCEPMRVNQQYTLLNRPTESTNSVSQHGFLIVTGESHRGDSGGPIFNAQGELVAIVSANIRGRNQALVRELVDTPLCS